MFSRPRQTRLLRHLPLLATLVLGACATPQPLPFGEVVTRSQDGQSPSQVVSAIRSSKTTYALRGSDFGKLKAAGVSDPVLDYLQQSFIDDVDLLTRYWVLGESVGGCARCVPQQVDLVDVENVTQSPAGTAYRSYAPQGMPDWYRPYSATTRTVSLDSVVQRARQGAPAQELVDEVRNGRLEEVVGLQSPMSGIRTHPTAGLPGSELARLREEGVPDPVLDEVQGRFLAQFVEIARLRYQNLGKGPAGPNP
jgi:hypothetical protein